MSCNNDDIIIIIELFMTGKQMPKGYIVLTKI